jgi:hypothetical protein
VNLQALPHIDSDSARAQRVRARCHTVLVARRARAVRTQGGAARRRRALESAAVGVFSLIYLCAVALFALQLNGAF